MGTAYLCGHTDIEHKTLQNSAAYINGWISALRGGRRLVVRAVSQAQKAVDYILGRKWEGEE